MKLLNKIMDDIGNGVLFLKELWSTAVYHPCTADSIYDQIWRVSIQSLPTTAMAGFFVGGILTIQFTMQIKAYGAMGFLGGLATSGTVREIGPLLIAFMLSGKVGAFTSAELGTMRVTEQIDAIRCLGANPIQEIILPRFLGIIVSSFFLLAVGLFMSIGGGLLMGVIFSGITPEEYLRNIPTILALPSVASGMFKCFCFAFLLAWVCTYRGYTTTGGAKGVGRSVINTAVTTMVGIVFLDWLTSLISDIVLHMFLGK